MTVGDDKLFVTKCPAANWDTNPRTRSDSERSGVWGWPTGAIPTASGAAERGERQAGAAGDTQQQRTEPLNITMFTDGSRTVPAGRNNKRTEKAAAVAVVWTEEVEKAWSDPASRAKAVRDRLLEEWRREKVDAQPRFTLGAALADMYPTMPAARQRS